MGFGGRGGWGGGGGVLPLCTFSRCASTAWAALKMRWHSTSWSFGLLGYFSHITPLFRVWALVTVPTSTPPPCGTWAVVPTRGSPPPIPSHPPFLLLLPRSSFRAGSTLFSAWAFFLWGGSSLEEKEEEEVGWSKSLSNFDSHLFLFPVA